jgi:RHS repeat-associated protein
MHYLNCCFHGVSQKIVFLLIFLYDVNNTHIGFLLDGIEYFYLTDLLGNIISILAKDGTEMVKYEYDAYGNIINSPTGTLSDINPYTYRGYRYDSEIGMYYLNNRYYNPQSGLFISSDGIIGQTGDIQSTNMYAYCLNNPVMNTDPFGYLFLTRGACALIGAAFSGTIVYLLASAFNIQGKNLAYITAGFTALGAIVGALVGIKILSQLNKMLKPIIYFFENPGKVLFGMKLFNIIQFELHNDHHGKGVHFVIRLFWQGMQYVWEYFF